MSAAICEEKKEGYAMSQRKRLSKAARRRRQRNRRVALFVIGLLAVGAIWFGILLFLNGKKEDSGQKSATVQQEEKTEVTPTPTATPTPEPLPSVDLSGINSQAAILVRLSDGQTVAEKEADTQIYPASMTKMMTALVAIENISDLNQTITLSQELFAPLYEEGASMAGFAPGDEVSALDLLYGVVLPSGAECCIGLADQIAGSESAFADMMNAKAQELGMTSTHFVTATGLHDPEHYTTVRDLTKLMSYALQNETFRTIFCTKQYTTSPVASAPDGLSFSSSMFDKMESPAVNGGEIEGGKTGYTSDAGLCLASLAVVDGTEYICVTSGAQGNTWTEPYHVYDAQNIYNQIDPAAGDGNVSTDGAEAGVSDQGDSSTQPADAAA